MEYNKRDIPKQLNPNNRLITIDIITELLKKYGIYDAINNIGYYQLAFIHKSYVKGPNDTEATEEGQNREIVPFQEESYERLEFIGDAILNAVIAKYLFERYLDQQEGFLTTLRTKLVRSQTLARLTLKLKLQKYILISEHEEKCNGRNRPKILEDIFESFIGALFLDFDTWSKGWNICQRFIIAVFEKYVDITAMIRKEDNYKRVLLEYYQKRFHTEPKYQIVSMRGHTNSRTYTMGALSPSGEIVGVGIAQRKTDAEQRASKKALIHYGEDVDHTDTEDSDSTCSTSSADSPHAM